MIEYGKVIALKEDKVVILIKRHAACGDCGACHVSKEQMEMRLLAENTLGASVGDDVELNIETVDFLSAVSIMYLVPLIALVVGVFAGYYSSIWSGLTIMLSQGIGAALGIVLMGASFFLIKLNEDSIKRMKKYRPVIISIRNKE